MMRLQTDPRSRLHTEPNFLKRLTTFKYLLVILGWVLIQFRNNKETLNKICFMSL